MEFDPSLLASIASGGLGRWLELEDGSRKYSKDDDCVACLKDLQGFFRFDDQFERPAFFAVSKYNFCKSDLVPLLVTYPDDYEVVYNTLKVCTHLTMQSPDVNPSLVMNQFTMMQYVCEAFVQSEDAIEVVVTLLAEPLSRHPKMKDRDASLVELVLTFLKNLLAATVPPLGSSINMREVARRTHGELMRKFREADVMDVLITIAQHARERPFRSQVCVLLETFLNVFNFIVPEQLLDIPSLDSVLAAQMVAEKERSRQAVSAKSAPKLPSAGPNRTVARFGPSRQQFAGAVFMRRHKDHSNSVLVRHSPTVKELPPMSQAPNKKRAKAQAREDVVEVAQNLMVTDKEIKLLEWLKESLEKFLMDAYTPLVGQVFKDATPGLDISRMEEDDFERFIRFVAFCTKYVRLREERHFRKKMMGNNAVEDDAQSNEKRVAEGGSPFGSISATMTWEAFHMVQVLFLICVDREAQRAKDKEKPYRQHVLLYSLGPMLREMLMTLDLARLAGNDADRQAADRLQRKMFYIDDSTGLLNMISSLIKDYKYHLHPRSHAVHLAEIFHVILATLDRLANHGSFQVSKKAAKRKQRKKKPAVQAQKQGGDENVAGNGGGNEVPAGDDENAAANDAAQPGPEAQEVAVIEDQDEEEEEEEDQEPEEVERFREVEFDAPRRLRAACAHIPIIQFYIWLLQSYKKNSDLTNNAIVSFLERIAFPDPHGLGLHCMLWQLSVIRTFHEIMSDGSAHKNPKYKRIFKLCIYVMRGLFKRLCPDLTEYTQKLEESTAKQAELEQELEDVQLIGIGEEDLEEKLEAIRKSIREVKAAADEAKLEIKMKEECASLAFVEILFNKMSTVAELIANEYNWKRSLQNEPAATTRHKASSDEFTEEQVQILVDAFEQCNGKKNCLDELVHEFGGLFKKVQISRKLKQLGLEKGKLTDRQKNLLTMYAERFASVRLKDRYQKIQEEFGGGFTARQIKGHMRKLGLIKPSQKRNNKEKNPSDNNSEMSDDDSSDVPSPGNAERAFDALFAEPSSHEQAHTNADDGDDEANSPPQSPPSDTNLKRKTPPPPDEAEAEAEERQAEARKRALDALRNRHKPGDKQPPAVEDSHMENADTNQTEPSSPIVKTFGRRLLKKSSMENDDGQLGQATMLQDFDDLADF